MVAAWVVRWDAQKVDELARSRAVVQADQMVDKMDAKTAASMAFNTNRSLILEKMRGV